MTETTTATPDQASGGADTSTQAVNTTSTTPGQAPGESIEDLKKQIADLRKENADRRTRLTKYEADEEARKLAAMGDLEKSQKQLQDAQTEAKQLKERLVHLEIELAASGKNIINPALIADNIFKSLEFEDGKPTNLDKALDELIKANPYLIKQSEGQTPAQTGAQQGAPNVPAMNPGRTNIQQPGTLQAGQVMRLEDVYRQQRNR